jgi:16S rRNA (guanine(966)-N(2))-methyltransferase RsmD
MRIISGSAKGTRLASPPDRRIRPTLDRVREACFSIIGPQIPGSRFLDLFAGTGANGLEALSRGAAWADFVESDPRARTIIEDNVSRTRFNDRAEVLGLSLPSEIDRLAGRPPYDFVYADPPHAFRDYASLLEAVGCAGLLTETGVLILEHATRTTVPDVIGPYQRVRDAVYGETTLTFFRCVHPTPSGGP